MSINPEKNKKVRALLYAIGIGGFTHLLAMFALAITQGNFKYTNPMYLVDLDKLWPQLTNVAWAYITGWLVFALLIGLAYRLIKDR